MTKEKNSSKKTVEPKEHRWIEHGYTPIERIRNTNKKPEEPDIQKTKPVKSSDDEK
ncbi:MAG: hypothetical protein PHS47_03185 [Methanocellales archaeon]|nr:hypothetical protein [Methanocellales archaeon]